MRNAISSLDRVIVLLQIMEPSGGSGVRILLEYVRILEDLLNVPMDAFQLTLVILCALAAVSRSPTLILVLRAIPNVLSFHWLPL